MTTPDQLEKEASATRESLGGNVAELQQRVSPSSFLQRRRDRLNQTASTMLDKVMGSADSPGEAAKDRLNSAATSAQQATDHAVGKIGSAMPTDPMKQTQVIPWPRR